MVDNATSTPGWRWFAATVAGVPALTGVLLYVASSTVLVRADAGWLGWAAVCLVGAVLATPALAALPCLRVMPRHARAVWAVTGAVLGAALTVPWVFAVFIAWLVVACHGGCQIG